MNDDRQSDVFEQSRDVKRGLIENIRAARRFFSEQIWDSDLSTLPRIKKVFTSLSRIGAIVVRGVVHDKCGLQASALTYLTLMSMVPVLALMFSVSKGLGAQEMLMGQIGLEQVPESVEYQVIEGSWLDGLPDQFESVAQSIFHFVDKANIKTLGGIGLLILFWTVIRVMGKIENSFNSIWGIRDSRTIFRRFADYISILVVVPILMIGATSVNAFLASDKALEMVRDNLGALSSIYEMALNWSVFAGVVIAFAFLFMFMPNTKVRLFPALTGALIAGGLWLGIQEFYFSAQVGVAKYNPIYGTFAVIPFFLFWLYWSWMIVLFGAEISFAVQNHRTYEVEGAAATASQLTRLKLALLIVYDIGRRHYDGQAPWNMQAFVDRENVSIRLVRDVVHRLKASGVIIEAEGDDASGDAFVPARDLEKISLADIYEAFLGSADAKLDKLEIAGRTDIDDLFAAELGKFKLTLRDMNLRQIMQGK